MKKPEVKVVEVDMGYGDEVIIKDDHALKVALERASNGYALVVKRVDGSILSSMFYPNESLSVEM